MIRVGLLARRQAHLGACNEEGFKSQQSHCLQIGHFCLLVIAWLGHWS